ncbi:MAG: 50S ribosomal protein L18 [Candidatus Levybacteria bacterium GW2011_GWB1_35_5]|nr:MAG: 50S ribosomal protein L18 [Candidatus Levybacteria bacterium GW2011_GWB1_35_5]
MKTQKLNRQKRVRAKIYGSQQKPRLSVFRSNKFIYVQAIDDENQKTIVGVSEKELKERNKVKKTDRAFELGKLLAKKVLSKKITEAVFDRGSYKYHGRVQKIAEGLREGGLKF